MGGNIAEWCLDWYVSLSELKNDIVPSMNPVVKDLLSAKSDGKKVCRGGAYYLSVNKVNYRQGMPPNRKDGEHGFRIVMEE